MSLSDKEDLMSLLGLLLEDGKPKILRIAAKGIRDQSKVDPHLGQVFAPFAEVLETSAMAQEAKNTSLTDDAVWKLAMSLIKEGMKQNG